MITRDTGRLAWARALRAHHPDIVPFDLDDFIDDLERPCKTPPLGPWPHTLLLLPKGLTPGRDVESPVLAAPLGTGPQVVLDGADRGVANAVLEGVKSAMELPPPVQIGALMMEFPHDYIGMRFPRNLPWKELPVLAAPRYSIKQEQVFWCHTAKRSDDIVAVNVDRRPVMLANVAPTVARVVIHLDDPQRADTYVHHARILLNIIGAPDVPIALAGADGTIEKTPEQVRAIHKRQGRHDRARYIYALNGRILFERAANALWTEHPSDDPILKGNAAPPGTVYAQRLAAELASDMGVLQSLYAVVRSFDGRGWSARTEMVSYRWGAESADLLRAEIVHQQARLASLSEAPPVAPSRRGAKPAEWWRNDHVEFVEGPRGPLAAEYTPEAASAAIFRCREIRKAPPPWPPSDAATEDGIRARIAHLEDRLTRVESRLVEVAAEEDRLLAHTVVGSKGGLGWDYGALRGGDATVWVGSGAHPPVEARPNVYRHSYGSGYTSILSSMGLVSWMWVTQNGPKAYTPGGHDIIDHRRGLTHHSPLVPTERGRALLALLPKECEDPDLLVRFEGIEDDDEAIRRMDRRLMKFFRELKRAVTDLSASAAPA